MLSLSQPRALTRSLSALLGVVLAAPLLASGASAQTAPVIGDHYAARASDTGFAGAVNSSGGYSASVPLDLPAARGGLPIPLQVVHGGNRFGAAGIGWDVPLSFIRFNRASNGSANQNVAYHRPLASGDAAPQGRDFATLTLDGSTTDLVRNAASTAWVGLRGSQQLEVRDGVSGTLELYDGNGLKYVFSSDGRSSDGTSIGPLDAGNYYLLSDVFGPSGTNVHLAYNFGAPGLGGGSTGLSIDLASVSYNYATATACAKHQVSLVYDTDAIAPLSLSLFGSTVLIRQHKLTAVDVTARENDCSGAVKSLRKYNFTYQDDPDIGQPRLHQVTMIGQEGTDERALTLPVATYSYGRFTGSDGKVAYRVTQTITLPEDFTTIDDGMAGVSSTTTTGGSGAFTLKGLFDVDGDNRPDLVYGHVQNQVDSFGTTGGRLARNRPASDGIGTIFTDAGFLNPVAPAPPGILPKPLPFISGVGVNGGVPGVDSHGHPDIGHTVRGKVTTQLIDMNGDGRLDIVVSDGTEESRHNWLVYLNAPDPASINGISWQPRTISTAPIVQRLIDAGFLSQFDHTAGDFLPLSQSFTSKTVHVQSATVAVEEEGETTFVEWRLQDINGDGFPDFVYNGSQVTAQLASNGIWKPDFQGSRAVLALMNVAGVHLDNAGTGNPGTNAFSAPVTIVADAPLECGLEKWMPGFAGGALGRSNQVCGLEDVNGDSIVDRVRSFETSPGVLVTGAQFGTGKLSGFFSGAGIALPGPVAMAQRELVPTTDATGTHFNAPTTVCRPNNATDSYPVKRIAGLRDLNGDGFPDYIRGPFSGSLPWTVAFGTGAGFVAPAVQLDSVGIPLSLESVNCQGRVGLGLSGTTAATTSGLYDIDGDGQPEYVAFTGNRLQVLQNQSMSAASSAAGQLVKIDSGYGAVTNITYRSAKEEGLTNHLLPYPEVVVASVTTTDTSNNPLMSPVRYAYGNASQYFDSASDRWVFPGYLRRITLQTSGDPSAPTDGIVTVTDGYPLAAFDPNTDATTRLLRYLKAGRIRDITTLSGDFQTTDPFRLLFDVSIDPRRIAATHTDYSARLLPQGLGNNQFCIDMVYPYDNTASSDYRFNPDVISLDQCAERGFAMATSVSSYRGTPGNAVGTAELIVSPQIVQTGSTVTAFDDLGRVTDSIDKGDLADNLAKAPVKDDLCVHVDYAALSRDATVRVLNAPATQTAQDCNGVTFAKKRFEYDHLPQTADSVTGQMVAQISDGRVTSSTVTRYDMDSHLPLADIRLFDATYFATGNLKTVTKTRDNDGATSTTTYGYDPFDLVAISTMSTASDPRNGPLPSITTSVTPDPLTLNTISATDANGMVSGMKRGATYDGFGRVLLSTVTPPGGSEGVLSSMTYNGFELIDTNGDGIPDSTSAGNRSIVQKVFTDAVPALNVATAPGRIGTTRLDNLGRAFKTEAQLGSDYNKTLVINQRRYDPLGRVMFVADPHLFTDSFFASYGTTYYYNTDGTPSCVIRGSGTQPFTASVDEANEVYPTCFDRSFANNKEILTRSDADALLQFTDGVQTNHQAGVAKDTVRNATGRILEQRTRNGTTLEDVTFDYDSLGHMTTMKRFKDPANKAAGAVTTTRHYDSLGWMTKLEEDGVAAQTRTFDSWGEITQTQWCDDLSTAPCPAKDRSSFARFDGRGRLAHREDQAAGIVVPGTAMDYSYDSSSIALQFVPRNNVLGRLASATWPTGQVWFTYDDFGRVNGRAFIDTTVTPNPHHYEMHERHDDGSEKTLHLQLQDTNKEDERVEYAYDSAGRTKSVVYNYRGSQTLFSASGSTPIYDAFGRITAAKYGLANFNASFAAAGRRLLNDVKVTSADGAHSREINFQAINGFATYDPVGRERQRLETKDNQSTFTLSAYDALGQLSVRGPLGTPFSDMSVGSATVSPGSATLAPPTIIPDRSFTYDPLGNIVTQTAASGPGGVTLSYQASDLDRVCNIVFGTPTTPPDCSVANNVVYDGAGNVVSEPTSADSVPATSGTRTFTYLPGGAVSTIKDGGTNATFNYDAFNRLQQLTLYTVQADMRADKYFGKFIKQRVEGGNSVITRQISAPGLTATRHGFNGGWTFAFGEPRGTRFVTDQTGAFVQDIDYQPFGEVKNASGATAGSANYTSEQWNGGDLLKALGVVNIGARVYDHAIGRFLSRDPIVQAGNPYAFADNDPINKSDPTGLMVDTKLPTSGGLDQLAPFPTMDPTNPYDQMASQTNGPNVVPDAVSGAGQIVPGSVSEPERLSPNLLERGIGSSASASPGQSLSGMSRDSRDLFASPDFGPPAPPVYGPPAPPAPRDPNAACRGNVICPAHWDGTTTPPGLGPYFSKFGQDTYHCGGAVFVETGCESSGLNFFGSVLYGECVYDMKGTCGGNAGDLIRPDNLLCGGCAGSADRFNSVNGRLSALAHTIIDEGGPTIDGNSLGVIQGHAIASWWHARHPTEPVSPDLINLYMNLTLNPGFW